MVVVGVDGSEGAAAALEYAAEEASLRETRLHVVVAWEVPPAMYGDPTFGGGVAPPLLDPQMIEAVRARAQRVADDASATAKELQPSLEVEALAVQGQPADVLLDPELDATLIVVGRRGLGGFKSLLLGSVSQQVVHYANCPVVVMNEPAAG